MHDFLSACIQLDPVAIVKAGGYLGVAAIIFAESGLLFGIFFPGDSLLFVAGLLSSGDLVDFLPLVSLVVVAAILGDSVGYWLGARVGEGLFSRSDSRFFKVAYLRRTERFFDRYGTRAIVLARFVPIVRTIAPMLAGVGSMNYSRFLTYNAIGGVLWGAGVMTLGHVLGTAIPNSVHYILPISLAIIVISSIPAVIGLLRVSSET